MKHWNNGKRTTSISGLVSHLPRGQKVHGFQSSIKNIYGKIITALLHRECGGSRIPQPSGWG